MDTKEEAKKKAKEFGDFLKKLRKEKNITLKDLEENTSYSNSYLSQIENGHKGIPNPETLKKIAKGLNVHERQLMDKAGYTDYQEESLIEAFKGQTKHAEKTIEVRLPAMYETELSNGIVANGLLTDDELRRRLFDLYELLNMNVDLYYKNEFLTDKKREKIKIMLQTLLE